MIEDSEKNIRKEFADTMVEVGKNDPRLIVFVGDISHFILQPFAKACPERYYNIGICEPSMVNMAAGLAKLGFIPTVHTLAPFLIERSFEQIKLDFGYQKLPINLISFGVGFDSGSLGVTHHCYDDFALMKNVEGMNIFYPASCKEFNILFKQMWNKGSNYFRIPGNKHKTELEDEKIIAGKGIKVKEGSDITIIVTGPQLKTVMDSVPFLDKEGISPEVIYLHTIRPFDAEMVNKSLSKTKKALVIEEHSMHGGVLEDVLWNSRKIENIKYTAINIGDKYVRKYGNYQQHCQILGFSIENIIKKIKEELY